MTVRAAVGMALPVTPAKLVSERDRTLIQPDAIRALHNSSLLVQNYARPALLIALTAAVQPPAVHVSCRTGLT